MELTFTEKRKRIISKIRFFERQIFKLEKFQKSLPDDENDESLNEVEIESLCYRATKAIRKLEEELRLYDKERMN